MIYFLTNVFFLQVYFVAKSLIFPIGDYIGKFGCGFLMLFLDIFIRFFALAIPFSTSLLRFTFVMLSSRFMSRTIHKWATGIIYMPLVVSILEALIVQFPPSDFAQGPYNYCLGRFEVYFNPQHPDPITPGRRQGLDWCDIHYQLLYESYGSWPLFAFRLIHFILCRAAILVYFVFVLSFPEAILYAITFWSILGSTNAAAVSGILRSDVLKRRKKQNYLNIYLTFWAWVIQYFTNTCNLLVTKYIYGRSPFLHSLFSLFQLTFNFTIMPFLYVLVADETIKTHLIKKEFVAALKLLFTMWAILT